MDDKMCAFSAYQALINATGDSSFLSGSMDTVVVYLSDNEELGSNLRQGAKGNFLDSVLERISEIFATEGNRGMFTPTSYPPSSLKRVPTSSKVFVHCFFYPPKEL
jgi:aspartyl aminopeptidase